MPEERNSKPRARGLLGFLLCSLLLASPAFAETIAIVRGIIVDPSKAEPEFNATVLITDDRIATIDASLNPPKDARVIDARDKYIVPGLWDMHAHLAALTPIGVAPEHYVAHGVLGVRDMGGYLDQLTELKAEINAGKRIGPDIAMAGPTLNGPPQPAPFHRIVATSAEARAAVDELKEAGVNFIKVHRQTTREAFFAIADETKKQHLTFAGHVPLVMSWVEASNAGMHSIEHIQTIFENLEPDPSKLVGKFPELLKRLEGPEGDAIWKTMVKNGTWFDPTMVGYEDSIDAKGPEMGKLRHKAFAATKVLMQRAVRSRVPMLAGTDILERHGERLLHELELLVSVGMPPKEVLAAATVNPAAALDRDGPGRIATGAPASLLVVDADPLADIANLRKLSTVVLRGRVLDAPELTRLKGMKIPPP
jgi:Amidohydrolase family